MRLKTIVFAWLVVLAASLNLALFVGDIHRPVHHQAAMWLATLVASGFALVLSLRHRTGLDAVALAARLVVVVQLLTAALVWGASSGPVGAGFMAGAVALTGGALLANIVSVTCLIVDCSVTLRSPV